MSEVGGAGSASGTSGPDSTGGVGDDSGVSEAEASGVAADAEAASDDDAATVGESIAAEASTDTFEGAASTDDDAVDAAADEDAVEAAAEEDAVDDGTTAEATIEAAAADVDAPAEEAVEEEPVEEPGLLEAAASYVGQTAKGYVTGAANTVLDAANLVNSGVNLGLEAVGVDYRFDTDMGIAPTSEAERHAQNAVTVASAVAGVAGLAKSAPAIARGVDAGIDAARGVVTGTRAKPTGPAAPAATATGTTTAVANVGDLRPSEVAKIQAAADELGADLYVVGSAAKSARRNVDTDLPLADFGAPKAGTRSDIDYAVRTDLDDAANALDLPDVDPSFGVRGVDYLTLDNSPAIRFSPGRPPELIEGTGRMTLD
ncbi:MAG: hypothetical protein RKU31_16395 [Deltaproteobacteria bacterium]|jgi:hypothetical protein